MNYQNYPYSYPYNNNYIPTYQQTPMQSIQPQPTIVGKVVDSIDIVRATDIPMNGETVYFPKADGTMIYSKRWKSDGTTEILSYAPHIEEETAKANTSSSDELKSVYGRIRKDIDKVVSKLDAISTKLDKHIDEEIDI